MALVVTLFRLKIMFQEVDVNQAEKVKKITKKAGKIVDLVCTKGFFKKGQVFSKCTSGPALLVIICWFGKWQQVGPRKNIFS